MSMNTKITQMAAVGLVATGMVMAALPASAGFKDCTNAPEQNWMNPQQLHEMLRARGYDVRKIKREGSCLEAYAIKDGKRVELYMDPTNGKVVRMKQKD